jgi:hypothetical protein
MNLSSAKHVDGKRINEYGAMLDDTYWGKTDVLRENLYQNQLFNHKPHLGLNRDPHLNPNTAPFFI